MPFATRMMRSRFPKNPSENVVISSWKPLRFDHFKGTNEKKEKREKIEKREKEKKEGKEQKSTKSITFV